LAKKWEAARAGQMNIKLAMEEEALENKLEEVARCTDTELRVHVELETFLESTIQVRQRKLNI
jgi:hypothetical protein